MATYIKFNNDDTLYPASISGRMKNSDWDERSTKNIHIEAEMSYEDAISLFKNGVEWSIVQDVERLITTEKEVEKEVTREVEVEVEKEVEKEVIREVIREIEDEETGEIIEEVTRETVMETVMEPVIETVTETVMETVMEPVTETATVQDIYDNSDYCILGDIIMHNDGTVTVEMGKLTDLEEAYEIMLGGVE